MPVKPETRRKRALRRMIKELKKISKQLDSVITLPEMDSIDARDENRFLELNEDVDDAIEWYETALQEMLPQKQKTEYPDDEEEEE